MTEVSRHPPDPDEDALAELLAACDEGLVRGELGGSRSGTESGSTEGRLQKDLDCLRLMRQAWKQDSANVPSAGTGSAREGTASPIPVALGRFQIVRELGRGGFGVVYLARDPLLNRDVAVKVPHAAWGREERGTQRLTQEAQAAARLQHPHIVALYERGTAEGTWFLVSEYCEGISLAEWIRQQTEPVSPELAAEVVRVLAGAVEHSHQQGVLHRDLKPANVLLKKRDGDSANRERTTAETPRGSLLPWIPKLTDFGLAKILDESLPELTRSGVTLRTPSYMSPEQAQGNRARITTATDVYGLGTILYELLTQRPPFAIETPLVTVRRVLQEDPVAPQLLRPSVPRDLETICQKCLQKNPQARYQTAAELADDLTRYLTGNPILARPISTTGRVLRWAARQPVVAGLLATLAVVVLTAFTVVLWQLREVQSHAQQTQDALDQFQNEQRVTAQERAQRKEILQETKELLSQFAEVGFDLAHKEDLDEHGIQVLERSLTAYESLIQSQSADPELQLQRARVLEQMGQAEWLLEHPDSAVQRMEQCIATLQGLPADWAGKREVQLPLSSALRELGAMERVRRNVESAEKSLRESEGVLLNAAGHEAVTGELVKTLAEQCRFYSDQHDYNRAVPLVERMLAAQSELCAQRPEDEDSAALRESLQQQLTGIRVNAETYRTIQTFVTEQFPELNRQRLAAPTSADAAWELVRATPGNLSEIDSVEGGEAILDLVIVVAEQLLKANSQHLDCRQKTSGLYYSQAQLRMSQKRWSEALPGLDRALELRIGLAKEGVPQDQNGLFAMVLAQNRVDVLLHRGQTAAAREWLEGVPAIERWPQQPEIQEVLANFRRTIQLYILLSTPQPAASDLALAEQLAALNLASSKPSGLDTRMMGLVRLRQGRTAEALQLLESAEAKSVTARSSTNAGEFSQIGENWHFVQALAYARNGNLTQAKVSLRLGKRSLQSQRIHHALMLSVAREAEEAIRELSLKASQAINSRGQ